MMEKRVELCLIVLIALTVVSLSGCSSESTQAKLPAIKVEFSHYDINGTHLLEIKKVDDVMINKSQAPNLYKEPPFPGIHLFAYNELKRTPITSLPLDKEGDNITTYIGFEDPKMVPSKGDKLLVVVDVVNQEGKSYDTKNRQITWDLDTENLNLNEIG
ncbi:MAG: hypothetical protein R6U44_02900 [Archaeoglobaceae archaeon]